MKKKIISFIRGVCYRIRETCTEVAAFIQGLDPKMVQVAMVLLVLLSIPTLTWAQDATAGVNAINVVSQSLVRYVPAVKKLLYVIASIVGMGGVVTIFVKMNNEEQDVKKTIMMVIGSCVALIALAEAVPMFFGVG